MLYSLNDAKAVERHETQYFEMFGNRGIYHKACTAVTRHKAPFRQVRSTRWLTSKGRLHSSECAIGRLAC